MSERLKMASKPKTARYRLIAPASADFLSFKSLKTGKIFTQRLSQLIRRKKLIHDFSREDACCLGVFAGVMHRGPFTV